MSDDGDDVEETQPAWKGKSWRFVMWLLFFSLMLLYLFAFFWLSLFCRDNGGIGCKTWATGERIPKVDEGEKKRWRRFTVEKISETSCDGYEMESAWKGDRRRWVCCCITDGYANLLFCLCFAETVEAEDIKELLPERLFATDRFPNKRVNTTVDYLLRVKNALNDIYMFLYQYWYVHFTMVQNSIRHLRIYKERNLVLDGCFLVM